MVIFLDFSSRFPNLAVNSNHSFFLLPLPPSLLVLLVVLFSTFFIMGFAFCLYLYFIPTYHSESPFTTHFFISLLHFPIAFIVPRLFLFLLLSSLFAPLRLCPNLSPLLQAYGSRQYLYCELGVLCRLFPPSPPLTPGSIYFQILSRGSCNDGWIRRVKANLEQSAPERNTVRGRKR